MFPEGFGGREHYATPCGVIMIFLKVVASMRAFFLAGPIPPPVGACTAVGRCNWRSQQKLASVGFGIASAGQHKETLPLSTARIVSLGTAGIRCHGRCRNTAGLRIAGILCCWALQEYSTVAVGHEERLCPGALQEILGVWALQGWALQKYCRVGHCRDTWWLGTAGWLAAAGTFGGWALQGGWRLQGHLVVGHCRDTWWLGTAGWLAAAGTFGGWALQGHSAVGHCMDTWWLGAAGIVCAWALQSGSGWRARTT